MKKAHIIAIVIAIVIVGFALSLSEGLTTGPVFAQDEAAKPSEVQACVTAPPNLVSWWQAENNYADSAGANGGTPAGSVGFVPGKVGQAFDLHGSSNSGDTISFGNPSNIQFTSAMTAEAWIRPDTTIQTFRTIVSKWSQTAQASWGLFTTETQGGGANQIYAIVGNSAGVFVDAGGGSIPTGPTAALTHVAMTYSVADGLKVYINGVNVNSDVSVGNIRLGSDVVRIGNDSGLIPNRYWDGLVDEVSLYNRALSAAEIQSIFAAGSDGKCSCSGRASAEGNDSNARPSVCTPPTPSPTPTPNCDTFTLSPRSAVYFSPSVPGRVTLTVAAGCPWQASSTESWMTLPVSGGVGPGDIIYNVAENSGDFRTGIIAVSTATSINGQAHIVSQNAKGDCPSERAAGDLGPLYGFRDEVLGSTQRGRKYRDDYYIYAGEITKLMIYNPTLFFRSKDVFERYTRVVESILERERARSGLPDMASSTTLVPTVVYDTEIDDIDQVLESFAAESSGQLKRTLEGLRRDVRDPQVQAEFGVRIERGPKRPLPSEQQGIFDILGRFLTFNFHSTLDPLDPVPASAPHSKEPTTKQAATNEIPAPSGNLYGQIPMSFEANKGQVDSNVKYLSRGAGYNLFLTPTEAVLSMRRKEESRSEFADPDLIARLSNPVNDNPETPFHTLRMRLDGANQNARLSGQDKLTGKSNYFVGKDQSKWRTGIPTYSRVEYDEVYRGIDLVYYGNQRQLEYDFKVAAGADPAKIRMNFDGAEKIEVDPAGELILHTAGGELRMCDPITYQEITGGRTEIHSRYKLTPKSNLKSEISNMRSEISDSFTIGFELGDYDKTKPLVIDPVIVYSTYLGGSGEDIANSITTDAAGNAYIIGFTDSTNFPVANARQPLYGGNPQDVFVSKINAAGTALVYSTYLGGSGQDNGSDIAVDPAGNAYITGYSGSTNFPVANALQATRTGLYNAFVAKLNPAGSQLVYSTYYGGTTGEYGSSIAVDANGNAYVGGVTSSANFPDTAGVVQANFGGSLGDAFVTKFNAAGNQVIYATFLGGNGNDGVTGIAIDPAGNAYVTGVTFSTNFPTASPLQASYRGGAFDAFVTKLNPAGTAMVYSTYLGGTEEDRGFRIELDAAGNVYVAGMTQSANFPTASAVQSTLGGGSDAFVTKLTPAGAISYSTFLGGSGNDGATGMAIDPGGSVFLTGFTASPNFPLAAASQTTYGGGEFDAFATKFNAAGTALNYSTYIGGALYDTGFDIAVDPAGKGYVVGRTASVNFPVLNPLQGANGGGGFDVFLTKFDTNISLSGRVTTPTGLGLRNAVVTLTDPQGARRNATTSSFGIYTFQDVRSGESYLLGVTSKRYRFASRTLEVNSNLTNVDFVGLE